MTNILSTCCNAQVNALDTEKYCSACFKQCLTYDDDLYKDPLHKGMFARIIYKIRPKK